jgi:hypothetical protein
MIATLTTSKKLKKKTIVLMEDIKHPLSKLCPTQKVITRAQSSTLHKTAWFY